MDQLRKCVEVLRRLATEPDAPDCVVLAEHSEHGEVGSTAKSDWGPIDTQVSGRSRALLVPESERVSAGIQTFCADTPEPPTGRLMVWPRHRGP